MQRELAVSTAGEIENTEFTLKPPQSRISGGDSKAALKRSLRKLRHEKDAMDALIRVYEAGLLGIQARLKSKRLQSGVENEQRVIRTSAVISSLVPARA